MSITPAYPGWDLERSPFHPGELAVQERVGVREKIDAQGRRGVRRYLTDQHRAFFPQLPYAFVGSVDAQGQPWASMLMAEPGFVQVPDTHTLVVKARPLPGDPLNETLKPGAAIALVGVQSTPAAATAPIGTVRDVEPASGFTIAVQTTMGLCPQYIAGREPVLTRDPHVRIERPVSRGTALGRDGAKHHRKSRQLFGASAGPRNEDPVASGTDDQPFVAAALALCRR